VSIAPLGTLFRFELDKAAAQDEGYCSGWR
jgi:hypothetical protein